MKILLDTDSCIYLLTGAKPALTERVAMCDEGTLAVSTITLAEMLHGSVNGKMPPLEAFTGFLEEIALLPFDAAAARAYADLPFRRGRFDRLIAAHAVSRGLTLVTNNEADFADIPGLTIENWTS